MATVEPDDAVTGPLLRLDPDWIRRLRGVLERTGYNEAGILPHLDAGESIEIKPKTLPRLLRMTDGGSPLDALIRLFILGVGVDPAEAAAAVAPMQLDEWIEGGLLARVDQEIRGAFRLLPFAGFVVAFDISPDRDRFSLSPHHVNGPGRISGDLLKATVRTPMARALDLGTGCGIQALALSRHCRQVVSTDINPRAVNVACFNLAVNGVEAADVRRGSLLEPVAGEIFDLITMNPPFAISPETRLIFRDGGMKSDGFVRRVVREAPAHLRMGGLVQLTAQWAKVRGQPWAERLAGWFEGSGCDTWVIELASQSVESYAEAWIEETEGCGDGFRDRWTNWMTFYEEEDIESISTGIINMRRTTRAHPWHFISTDVDGLDEAAGAAIADGLIQRDFLSDTDDAKLLETALRVAADARLEQVSSATDRGWQAERFVLRRQSGLKMAGNLDSNVASLLERCDGSRALAAVLAELASNLELDVARIVEPSLPIVRALIERGLLVPVTP
jgi:hypothetical protein